MAFHPRSSNQIPIGNPQATLLSTSSSSQPSSFHPASPALPTLPSHKSFSPPRNLYPTSVPAPPKVIVIPEKSSVGYSPCAGTNNSVYNDGLSSSSHGINASPLPETCTSDGLDNSGLSPGGNFTNEVGSLSRADFAFYVKSTFVVNSIPEVGSTPDFGTRSASVTHE
jgi:hypothetical protein